MLHLNDLPGFKSLFKLIHWHCLHYSVAPYDMHFFVEEGGGGEEAVTSRNSIFVYQLQQEVRTPCIVNDIVPALFIILLSLFSFHIREITLVLRKS